MTSLHSFDLRRIAPVAFASVLGLTVASAPAAAQTPFVFEYAAKVVCGKLSEESGILAGGRYFTAVNVHNPGRTASLRRKVAVAGPGDPGRVSPFEPMRLRHDEALEIDCKLVQRQAGSDWVKGFLVIQSSQELDVVAVYTTSAGNGVNSFHTERVPMRRMVQ